MPSCWRQSCVIPRITDSVNAAAFEDVPTGMERSRDGKRGQA